MKKNKKVVGLFDAFCDGYKNECEYNATFFNQLISSFYKQGFKCEHSVDIGVIVCEIENLGAKVSVIFDLEKDGIEMKYAKDTFNTSFTVFDKRLSFHTVLESNPSLAFVGKLKEYLDIMPNSSHDETTHDDGMEEFMMNYNFRAQENGIFYGITLLVKYEEGRIKIDCIISSKDKNCTATGLPKSVDIVRKTIEWFQITVNSILDGNAIINSAFTSD